VALRPQDKARGLAAFDDSRQTRRRAIVLGRVRVREVATRFWLWTFAGLLVFSVAYYRYSEVQLAGRRSEVMAQQRAVVMATGADGFVLRDKLEGWVLSLAREQPANYVAPTASIESISRGPGIYLRLPKAEASSVESIRRAAPRSLHDGFTSCLFVGRAGDPKQGTPCKASSQCGPGELCASWSVCAVPNQPFNLQLLYSALRVVGPDWASGLEAAQNDLQVRAIELDLQDAAKHEVPAAVEMVRRSKYFTVVLDELPEAMEPAPADDADAEESPDERLQASDHFVRVGVWDIERGEPVLALRIEAAGRFVAVGQHVAGRQVLRAQQRQANNCAVATEVREALRGRAATVSVPTESAAAPPTP
jgi:hypothetical protein